MTDTRFTTVVDDVDDLLDVMDIDELGDVETLLMFLFARPIVVRPVPDDDDAATSLEVIVQSNDLGFGCTYEFPLSMAELARSCAETMDEVGAGSDDGPAREGADVLSMNDSDLLTALQQAMGKVRLFNLLDEGSDPMMPPPEEDSGHEPYDLPRGTCPACGSGEVTHLVNGLPAGPDVSDGGPEWVHWVGCVDPGYSRECGTCGATWSDDPAPGRL